MNLIRSDKLDFFYINREEDLARLHKVVPISSLSYIALDTESYALTEYGSKANALDPYTSRVRLISLHIDGETYVIDCHYVNPRELLIKLSDCTVIAHNAVHDIKAIKASFDIDIPLKCTHTALCTLAVSTGWKAYLMMGKALDDLARDFFSVVIEKKLSISDWSLDELSHEQLLYSALDVAAPKSLEGVSSIIIEAYKRIEQTCEEIGQKMAFDLDQDMVPILADMAINGLPMNKELLSIASEDLSRVIDKSVLKLCRTLSIPIEERLSFDNGRACKKVFIPPNSSKLLNNNSDLVKLVSNKLKSSGEPLSDLQADTLLSYIKALESADEEEEGEDKELGNQFKDVDFDIQLLKDLLEYKKMFKLKGEVDKYISNLNVVTGCLHTNTNVIGTATARMSSSGGVGQARVNIQQISTIPFQISYKEDSQLFDL